jgi:hypothetical protein
VSQPDRFAPRAIPTLLRDDMATAVDSLLRARLLASSEDYRAAQRALADLMCAAHRAYLTCIDVQTKAKSA